MNAICRLASGLAAAAAVAVVVTVPVAGQSKSAYTTPLTPWGEPDLQGTYNSNDLQGVPMQRAETLGTRDTLNDDEYRQRIASRDSLVQSDNDDFSLEQSEKFESFGAIGGPISPPPHWLERAKSVSRQASFLIEPANGRMPDMTPAAKRIQEEQAAERKARAARLQGREADTYTDRSLYDRCITLGILGSTTPKIYNSGSRIVQGPGWVAFTNEMIHETRVIPTDGRANAGPKLTSWMGNGVGHWEGDTLVVVTRNIRAESLLQGLPLSSEGKVIERFRMRDAKTLEYKLTVDDPKMWTQPWTMMLPIPRDDGYGLYEYACHEGNYTMFNILSGARAQEKAAK